MFDSASFHVKPTKMCVCIIKCLIVDHSTLNRPKCVVFQHGDVTFKKNMTTMPKRRVQRAPLNNISRYAVYYLSNHLAELDEIWHMGFLKVLFNMVMSLPVYNDIIFG